MTARQDFDEAMDILADMLELKLSGVIEFDDEFQPWEYLRYSVPLMVDDIEQEATGEQDRDSGDWVRLSEVRDEFLARDPNNVSRMRGYLER